MEIGEGESFGVVSLWDRLGGAPASAAVDGAFGVRIRMWLGVEVELMAASLGRARGLAEAWADLRDLDVESGEGGLARGRDVRVPGGYDCTREGIEGAQFVVSRGQTDSVEALAKYQPEHNRKRGEGVVGACGLD